MKEPTFRVDAVIVEVRDRRRSASVPGMLADTGSEFTWVPAETLRELGVRVEKRGLRFVTADGRAIRRDVGYAIVRVGEFETIDEVVFALPGDLALLGARTLEGFGALVDARGKRLVSAGPHPAAAA